VIVVATDDFEVYHDVVAELRERDATFTTVERDEPLPESAGVVIVAADEAESVRAELAGDGPREGGNGGTDTIDDETADGEDGAGDQDEGTDAEPRPDDVEAPGDVEVVVAEPENARAAVEEALQLARQEEGRLVVGVDPGDRPGIAILTGETVVAAFQVPVADAAEVIRREVADATDPVVRIGDGARRQGARLIDALEDVRVELVDETGTTPSLGAGVSGVGDVLAAVNIARREGEVVEAREIDPTAGELRSIQQRSREAATDNRAIDERLARRVARGELTVEEALAERREDA